MSPSSLSAGGVSLTAMPCDGSDRLMSTDVLADEALTPRRLRRRRRRLVPSHEFTARDMTGEFTFDDDDSSMNRLLFDDTVCSASE